MSDLNQIHTALNRLFHEEGQRIVFWNDPDQEFFMTVPLLELDGVTTLRLDEVGALEAKIRLEREEPNGKFLLYSPTEEPDYEDDWLLDIRLYSRSFRADKASILLQELGLVNLHLRTHVSDRRKFFDAKDRLQKIKNLVAPDDAAADLDRKMIAVVAKADQPELFNLVRTIFDEVCRGQRAEGSNETADCLLSSADSSPVFGQIEKFDLDVPFWNMVKATFGYEEENPTLMCRSRSVGCSCRNRAGQTPLSAWLSGETAAAREQVMTGCQRMQQRSSRSKITYQTWRSTSSPK